MPQRANIALYHITSWQNLAGIIASNSLFCANERKRLGLTPISAAYKLILERRERIKVPFSPGGVLADYEPFAFAPRSPMLCAIANDQIPGVTQRDMVHLRMGFERVEVEGLTWVFSDGHPTMRLSQISNKESDFSLIDWPLIKARHWANTENDGDRSRRRQAEFLIHRFVPWELIDAVGVFDADMYARVKSILKHSSHQPSLGMVKAWYYEQ